MAKPSSAAGTQQRRSRPKSKLQTHEQQIAQTLAALDQLDVQTPQAAKAISLLRTWLGDDSGYDEQVWPTLKKSLNRERASGHGGSLMSDLPITTAAMLKAAEFWADARRQGHPTARDAALDADVILAAQAASLGKRKVIVASTNPRHLQLFVTAEHWQDIVA